tara:strand:- start:61 stop:228 length:168 start_codon:yes stop_codon:yes gene_type:complete
LLIADWLKNKNAQKILLTPEIKPHDKIRLENIFLNFLTNRKMVVMGNQSDKNCQF